MDEAAPDQESSWRPDGDDEISFGPPSGDPVADPRPGPPTSASPSPWAPTADTEDVPLLLRDDGSRRPDRRGLDTTRPIWQPTAVDTSAESIHDALVESAEVGPSEPALDERAETDDDAVDVGEARHDGRAHGRGRRVVAVVAVAVLVVGALVVVRSLGGGTERVDGPRLPEVIAERWAVPLDGESVLGAVVTEQMVVVATLAGPTTRVSARAVTDGSLVWEVRVDAVPVGLYTPGDGLLVVDAAEYVAGGRMSFALDMATGERVWERPEGIVLARPETGRIAIADASGFSAPEPSLALIDLVSGRVVPPVGGRLVGLGADGDVLVIDDEGDVRSYDVSAYQPGDEEIASTLVATTSPDRRSVVELAGRYFASTGAGLVEIGFAADAGRVLLDRRPDEQRSEPLPAVNVGSLLAPVDDRHAVMLGGDGAMGIELRGDELRVNWSAPVGLELPRRVDGGRLAVEVWLDDDELALPSPGQRVDGTSAQLVDAITGRPIVEYVGVPSRFPRIDQVGPVDGVLGWDGSFTVADDGSFEVSGTVSGLDLDGDERWVVDGVSAGPFVGDRTLVVERRVGEQSSLVFFDEGPNARD